MLGEQLGRRPHQALATPGSADLAIPGVRRLTLEARADERGSFTEAFRDEWFPGLPSFVQGNLSRSRTGVLRGLHYHRRQADLWVPVDGTATVGLVDLREDSPTDRESLAIDVEPGIALYLPPGVAHGFCARTDFTLLYLVDRAYDGADEFGFSPLDPAAAIAWPVAEPILSDRDRKAPSLVDALATAPIGRSTG